MKHNAKITNKYAIGLAISLSMVVLLAAFLTLKVGTVYAVTNTVSANVVVRSFCFFTASNSLITFPSTSPGTTSTANVVTFTDPVGNAVTNVLIQATTPTGNWIGLNHGGTGADQFYLSNTLYGKAGVSTPATSVTTTATDSLVLVGTSGSNSIWFAVSIPAQQEADTYNAVISAISSC